MPGRSHHALLVTSLAGVEGGVLLITRQTLVCLKVLTSLLGCLQPATLLLRIQLGASMYW